MKNLTLISIVFLLIVSCKKEEVLPTKVDEFSIQSINANSTYNIVAGRSKKVTGPFLDNMEFRG